MLRGLHDKRGVSMKRRDFIAAAGVGAGGVLLGTTAAAAEDRPAEKRRQVYQCAKCSTIVEVIEPGKPTLVHCSTPMKLLPERTKDIGREKHVPVVEKIEGGYKVKVGSVAHPMLEKHYIPWIELLADGVLLRRHLKPGEKPEAIFKTTASDASARAYCNLHGLWKSS